METEKAALTNAITSIRRAQGWHPQRPIRGRRPSRHQRTVAHRPETRKNPPSKSTTQKTKKRGGESASKDAQPQSDRSFLFGIRKSSDRYPHSLSPSGLSFGSSPTTSNPTLWHFLSNLGAYRTHQKGCFSTRLFPICAWRSKPYGISVLFVSKTAISLPLLCCFSAVGCDAMFQSR